MKISSNINQYVFKNNQSQYVIYNYDYFTTDYRIPNNSELSELSEYSCFSSSTLSLFNSFSSLAMREAIEDISAKMFELFLFVKPC